MYLPPRFSGFNSNEANGGIGTVMIKGILRSYSSPDGHRDFLKTQRF